MKTAFYVRSFCIAVAVAALASKPANADWCETAPGSQTYTNQNCAKQENTYDLGKKRQSLKPAPKREEMRDILKRALARKAEHERAAQAAFSACESGDAKGFRANLEVARRSGDGDQDTKGAYDRFAQTCEAKFADVPVEPPAVAAPPESASVKTDPLDGWPAECRVAAASLVAGGRKNDGVAASTAYAMLHDDRTCSPYLSSLAGRAGARLPERKMSDRSRRALQQAMSGEANQLVGALPDRAYDASYDASEVLNFGLVVFGTLGNARLGVLRASTVMRVAPHAQSSSPSASFRPQPPPHQSDITGTR